MSEDRIGDAIVESLLDVAPEVDAATLDGKQDLREQCDLDSMDFLNFVIGIHQRLGIDIPEADYPKLVTIERARAYVKDAVGQSAK